MSESLEVPSSDLLCFANVCISSIYPRASIAKSQQFINYLR